jgi:hypothetical protein
MHLRWILIKCIGRSCWTVINRYLPILLLAILPTSLRAQSVSGGLQGRVLDDRGNPLDHVAVSVGSPAIQGLRFTSTNPLGVFFVPNLPPGSYAVDLARVGYWPARVENILVELGETIGLGDVTLAVHPITMQPVIVNARHPAIDPLSAAASTVLPASTIRRVPTERNVWSVAFLAPQTTPTSYNPELVPGPNVAGATELENAYYTDGVNVTDLLDMRGSMILPYNFVREVQVLSGGYEAEYGQAQGAILNAVTYTGGNTFHGELVGYYTGDALRTEPRWGSAQEHRDQFSNYDIGGSIGGPISQDRLWFFTAYNPSFETRTVSVPGLPPQDDNLARHSFAGKLTWRASSRDALTFTALGDPTGRDGVVPTNLPLTVESLDIVLGRINTGMRTVMLQERHETNTVTLTAAVSRTSEDIEYLPRDGKSSDVTAITRIDDYTTNTISGGFGWWQDAAMHRTTAEVSALARLGAHLLKVGLQYREDSNQTDYQWSWLWKVDDPTVPYNWLRMTQLADVRNRVPTVYVQDSWRLGPRVRVNPGLRWEAQFMSGNSKPDRSITNEWAPRLGIIVEPGKIGVHKIALAVGRFYEVIPTGSLVVWNGSGAQINTAYDHNPLEDPSGGRVLSSLPMGAVPGESDLRGQNYDEISIGYERRIGSNLRADIRAVGRSMRWIVEDGIVPSSGIFTMGNPGRGVLAELPRAKREYRALEFTLERPGEGRFTYLASYVLSHNWGNYTGIYATDIPPLGFGGNSTGQFDGSDLLTNGDGPLPNDRLHVFKLAGGYRSAWGLSIGSSLSLASGTPRNEYGTSVLGVPYWTFVRQRGSAGRTPWIWDLDLRLAYSLPARGHLYPRVVADVLNIGSPRQAIWYDDVHYNAPANPDGTWPSENPSYGSVLRYQDPMSIRLGMAVTF